MASVDIFQKYSCENFALAASSLPLPFFHICICIYKRTISRGPTGEGRPLQPPEVVPSMSLCQWGGGGGVGRREASTVEESGSGLCHW